jgi:type IV secretion system protein VirB10
MLSGGLSAQAGAALAEKKKTAPSSDPNYAFAQGIADSKTEPVEATQVKNLNRTLVQGKLIQGVLETAIDSELPGDIRAIVSHDVYAESGRAILIPKGSRLVGTYNSSVKRGQARVFIIWQRVVRPDGVDVVINSPGVDALGRAGMTGFVDNKYFEAFSTALLTSALDIGVATAGDALLGNGVSTVTTNGVTTQNLSGSGTALQSAMQNLGSVGQSIVTSTVNLQPTIHIDQGELINIFVNKDVVFPPGLDGVAGFVP